MRLENPPINFRTRYGITVIDSKTQKPRSATTWVDNMVLNSGITNLGNPSFLTGVAVGTSPVPAAPTQTNLINIVGTARFSDLIRKSHTVVKTGDIVTATIAYETTIKSILFPQNRDTLDLCEIGIPHSTRAVLDIPLTIAYSEWVHVQFQLIYVYGSATYNINTMINTPFLSQSKQCVVSPFVADPAPTNTTDAGYGAPGAVTGYLWDADLTHVDITTFAANTGLTVTQTLDKINKKIWFKIAGTLNLDFTLPGFIIKDLINGGGFQLTFTDGLFFEEDDTVLILVSFNWAQQ
ncbi:MAG: hypothetical protein [Bacteriophage sp.]|nr:MAG: hypothetical protein [Bacteriophage sp.]